MFSALQAAVGDVKFVSRRAFASGRRSATQVAVLNLVLAALPSAQVVATAALIDRLRHGVHLHGLIWPLAVVVAVVGLSGPLLALSTAVQERSMLATEVDLQSELAAVVADMSPARLTDPSVVAEVERHSHAIIDSVSHVYGRVTAGVCAAASAAAVVVTLALMSPLAAGLVTLAVGPAVLVGKLISGPIERMWRILGAVYDRDGYLRDILSRQRSVTELASLGTAHRVADMVSAQQRRVAEVRDLPVAATIRAQLALGGVGTVLLGGAVVAVVTGMHYGPTAVAGVYAVIAAMAATSTASGSLTNVLQFLPLTSALRRFLDDAPPPYRQPIAEQAGELVVSGLCHRYATRAADAVADVDLRVRHGEMIALVGVNGAGKTTIVNALLGLIEPTAGTVTVDGRKRSELGEAAWLGHFGLLTQEFGRYEFTVREAVALGTPEKVPDERVWAALETARAADFVRGLPDGLDSQLGEQWGGVGISGGQWQRLALARICLRGAPIWILDEPTSAIDAEAEQEVFQELARTKAERITIVVSHRAWTLRGMDRIHVVDGGRIVESGSYEELMRSRGRFAEIFAEQA